MILRCGMASPSAIALDPSAIEEDEGFSLFVDDRVYTTEVATCQETQNWLAQEFKSAFALVARNGMLRAAERSRER